MSVFEKIGNFYYDKPLFLLVTVGVVSFIAGALIF